jgi:hypothetical protein
MHPNRHAIAFGSLVFLVVSIVLIIAALFWGWPKYKVYKKEMDGIAALKEAEWSKQILIEEAKAREQVRGKSVRLAAKVKLLMTRMA